MRPASKLVLVALATSIAAASGPAAAQTPVYQQPVYQQPPPEEPAFAFVPPRPTTPSEPQDVSLSVEQLLVNQRIAQAAVRRSNAVQRWLEAGIMGRDLAGGAIQARHFDPRSVTTQAVPPRPVTVASPRPVTTAAAAQRDGVRLSLTVRQLVINQRISAAAVRRSNALAARLDAGLTGGDLGEGAITADKLQSRLGIVRAVLVPDPPAATRTVVPSARPAPGARFTLSRTQLLTNQRISQAAVRRSNALVDRLRAGLGDDDFRERSITARSLVPELRRG